MALTTGLGNCKCLNMKWYSSWDMGLSINAIEPLEILDIQYLNNDGTRLAASAPFIMKIMMQQKKVM